MDEAEVSMINPDDYEAGWTQKTFNPASGKWPSGAAARNMLLAREGGAQAVRNAGAMDAFNLMAPLLEQYQNQLDASQKISNQLLRELQKIQQRKQT